MSTIFFYCEPDNPRTLEGTFVLISLINQLYPFLSRGTAGDEIVNVQKAIATFFGTDRTQPDFWDLRDILMDMNSLIPDATYIMGGLDSLNQEDIKSLLIIFRSLLALPKSSTRILLFSRRYLPGNLDISTALPNIRLIPTSSNVKHDIEFYVAESIREKMMYKKLTDNVRLVEDIKHKLVKASLEM
jgi:hypothetical protein